MLNDVDESDIRLCEVDEWSIKEAPELDLVVSRKSWGFHYPISEYLEEVAIAVRPGGCVITDIRRGQNGEKDIRKIFGEVSVISSEKKSDLTYAVKKD